MDSLYFFYILSNLSYFLFSNSPLAPFLSINVLYSLDLLLQITRVPLGFILATFNAWALSISLFHSVPPYRLISAQITLRETPQKERYPELQLCLSLTRGCFLVSQKIKNNDQEMPLDSCDMCMSLGPVTSLYLPQFKKAVISKGIPANELSGNCVELSMFS